MNILLLSHKPPYPIVDGGCLAMARLLEDLLSLTVVTNIKYVAIGTHKHPFSAENFPKNPKLSVQTHFIDTRVNLKGAALALLKQESYNLTRFKNEALVQALKKELRAQSYDFVIFESLFAAVYAPLLRKASAAKFIYRAHNIEHQIWKDLASNTKNRLKKWYLQQLAYSLKWAERSIWSEDQGALDVILTISNTDLAQIENQTLTTCKYLPASTVPSKAQSNFAPNALCFLGAFDWAPNVEAVDWFLQHVYTELRKKFPDLTFHIAGKGADKIKQWQQNGVFVHGFVPDPKEFIAQNGIFIGSLQSGSGVKMKIIEAMSVGAPLVLSPKSADGLPDLPAANLSESATEFSQALEQLLTNPEKMQANAAFNKSYYQKHFEATVVQRQLQQILDELQNNR
ncbi:MAG: glycosyltransferase family 4 protein [Flavobacteriales bacterium]